MKNKPNRIVFPSRAVNRHRGFTLVELLVVITIIVVLAAVVVVVTRRIKASAYQANAMSSLRQVAAFNVAYSTENNGEINTLRYPGAGKESKPNWVSNTYWGRLQPYAFPDAPVSNQGSLNKDLNRRLDQLFNTPDADKMVNTILAGSKIYHDGSGLPVPLAFNINLYDKDDFKKVSAFEDPSRVMHAVYGFGLFDESDGRTYVPRPKDGSIPKNNIYYLDNQSVLASFLDGHLETLSAPIPDRKFK